MQSRKYTQTTSRVVCVYIQMPSIFNGTQVEDFQERIQGELSLKIVVEALSFTGRSDEKTTQFLYHWINGISHLQLRNFVKAVTGSTALRKKDKITVQLITTEEPNRLPTSHTCSMTLDLPITYSDQQSFNKKLDRFIEESLAGTGFQYL